MKHAVLAVTTAVSLLGWVPGAYAEQGVNQDAPATVGARSELAPLLRLGLSGESASSGDVLTELDSSGTAPVVAVVVTSDGGQAVRVARGEGGWAAMLPSYSSSETSPPRAVIRVVGIGARDAMNPLRRDFRFGAAFNLDPVSQGSDADNGNNLVQRGLYGDGAQYKLQLDDRVPMCSVQGDEGAVAVEAERVEADQWYRARCYREGPDVTLLVWKLTPDGPVLVDSATESGSMGSVDFDARVPLSAGGKLDATGAVLRGSGDQFNGMVDNIVFDAS